MKLPFKTGDRRGHYEVSRQVSDEEILEMARKLINRRFVRGRVVSSPDSARDFLVLKLAHLEHELFCALFLDNRHRVLAFEEELLGEPWTVRAFTPEKW
jgi:DNA repair protein RadC